MKKIRIGLIGCGKMMGAHVGTRIGTPWLLREGTSALVIRFKSGAIGYHGATWGARGSRLSYDFPFPIMKASFLRTLA